MSELAATTRHLDAVEEVPVWIEPNGVPAVTWMCTPERATVMASAHSGARSCARSCP